jgi:lipoate-protein ligase B
VLAQVIDLGQAEYQSTWDRQLELVSARQKGEACDTLLLVEHPHVITLGRRRAARANVLLPGDVPVVEIERGGDVTYHGPGQLVAYPIISLADGERDLHRFLRNLEEAIIRTAADLGVTNAGRKPGATGVWVADRKLASIGIACRRWVTFHGLALNVSTDLTYFARINPCGFNSSVMTSLTELLSRPLALTEVKPLLTAHLSTSLNRPFGDRILGPNNLKSLAISL